MQHGDDNVIEVSSAKRANAKNLSGESDSQHQGAPAEDLMKTELV